MLIVGIVKAISHCSFSLISNTETTYMQEKTEINIRKLRQTFCLKARSAPDFYNDREASRRGRKRYLQIDKFIIIISIIIFI